MDIITSATLVQGAKFSFLGISLLVALIIVIYNWLYLVRVFSSHDDTDLHPPKNIARLVKASIFTALLTVVLIIFFFITEMY